MNELMQKVKKIADAEIKDAREYRDDGLASFRDDKTMQDMYRADCRDRIKAARHAKKGQLTEAHKAMTETDTAVRDSVTDDFWNLIVYLKDI